MQNNLGQLASRTSSGVGLWRADPLFTGRQFDHCLPDLAHAVGQVDMAPLQAGQLTPSHAAHRGDQYEGSEPALHSLGQLVDLPNSEHRPLGAALNRCPFMWHGFDSISLSSNAVDRIDRSSRYAFAVLTRPRPP